MRLSKLSGKIRLVFSFICSILCMVFGGLAMDNGSGYFAALGLLCFLVSFADNGHRRTGFTNF